MIPNSAAAIALALKLAASAAFTQTPAPQPGTPSTIVRGLVPRAGVHVGLIHLTAADPRFNWAARFGTDIDIYDYGKGRLSLVGEYEAVFGSERRVVHHVSRHLTDRENDRAVAWNSIGAAASRDVSRGQNHFQARFDLAHVFQHTFNDYTWTAWLTLAADRAAGDRLRVFAKANGGFQGVDR